MALRHLGKSAWVAGGLAASAIVVPSVAYADKAADDEEAKEIKRRDRMAKAMFDPEALERGATALREINKSSHAKQVSVNIGSGKASSLLLFGHLLCIGDDQGGRHTHMTQQAYE